VIKEAIEKILSLADAKITEIDGRPWADRALRPIRMPHTQLEIHTLASIARYANLSPSMFLVVESPTKVSLLSRDPLWKDHKTQVVASAFQSNNAFIFGNKYDVENFIIRLFTEFEQNEDRDRLLTLVSSLTTGASHLSEDDGISQMITVRKGITLKGEVKQNPRVTLRPYRTFHEIPQPESSYIFRVHQSEGEAPKVALHEGAGGLWQQSAVIRIAEYLSAATENKVEIMV
jgi:hypothetical protein